MSDIEQLEYVDEGLQETTDWPKRLRWLGGVTLGLTLAVDVVALKVGLNGIGLGAGSAAGFLTGSYMAFMGIISENLPSSTNTS